MNEKEGERLLFFNGTECSHCKEMHPLVGKLEKEEKVHVTELEVWHDSKNMALLQKLDNGNCGGMSEMKFISNVWRRENDRIRRRVFWQLQIIRIKKTALFPEFINLILVCF